jgi:hypothetical protein
MLSPLFGPEYRYLIAFKTTPKFQLGAGERRLRSGDTPGAQHWPEATFPLSNLHEIAAPTNLANVGLSSGAVGAMESTT